MIGVRFVPLGLLAPDEVALVVAVVAPLEATVCEDKVVVVRVVGAPLVAPRPVVMLGRVSVPSRKRR